MQRNRWSKSIRNCDNYWPGLFSLPQFRESRVPACIPATPDPTFGRLKKKTATQHTSTVVRKLCFYISTWRVYWDILRDSTRQNTSLLPMLWTNCSKSDPKTELPLVALFIGKNPTLNFNHQFRVTFFSKVTTMMFPGHKWSYGAP